MATYSPLDMKIKKELALKAQKQQRKKRTKGPEVSAVMDNDNDDLEFSDAAAEEIQDAEEHEQTGHLDGSGFMTSLMASRKPGFGDGRSSFVEKVLERSQAGAALKRQMSAAARGQALAAGGNDGVADGGQTGPYLRPGRGSQGGQGGGQEQVEMKVISC